MKKVFNVLGVCAVSLALIWGVCRAANFERYVNSAGTQIFLLDDSGNLTVPATVSAAGVTNTGNTTNSGNVATTGITSFPRSSLNVGASSEVTVTSSYVTVISSSNNVLMKSKPNISTATANGGSTALPDGAFLIVKSTGCDTAVSVSSVTFQDEQTLSGSRMRLGAASRTVSCFKVLTLMYDATTKFWNEINYANNP